jgi:acylphosphatase
MPGVCCRFVVSGRVQGVFFRDSTRRMAIPLEISGHAINLPDGTVEVLACGSPQAVAQLAEWLHDGPPAANVTGVEELPVDVLDCRSGESFRVG